MSGFIRDVQVADFDGDGREELVFALVTKSGAVMLTTPQSTLIAYELEAVSAGPQVPGSSNNSVFFAIIKMSPVAL